MIKRCFATERSVVPQMTFTASGTFEFTKSPSTLIISSGIVNKDERKISGPAKMHPIDADPAASLRLFPLRCCLQKVVFLSPISSWT